MPGLDSLNGKPNPTQAALQLLAANGALIVPDSLAFDGQLTRVTSRGSGSATEAMFEEAGMAANNESFRTFGVQSPISNGKDKTSERTANTLARLKNPSPSTERLQDQLLKRHIGVPGDQRPLTVAANDDATAELNGGKSTGHFRRLPMLYALRTGLGTLLCLAYLLTAEATAELRLQSDVSPSGSLYVYQYTANNQTTYPVIGISVEVFGDVAAIQSPSGWVADVSVVGNRSLVNWFSTVPGQSDVAAFGTRGGFSFRSSFRPGTVSFAATDTALNFLEGITTGPISVAGDYNADGEVTAADFNLWRQYYGIANTPIADGNANGRVDTADYTVWRDNLNASASAAAVPEPSAVWLVLVATSSVSARLTRFCSCFTK